MKPNYTWKDLQVSEIIISNDFWIIKGVSCLCNGYLDGMSRLLLDTLDLKLESDIIRTDARTPIYPVRVCLDPAWSWVDGLFVIGHVQLLKLMDFVLCQFLFEDMIAAFDKILNLLGL